MIMKRLIVLFGVLDFITLIWSLTVSNNFAGIGWGLEFQIKNIAMGILLCSFLFSGYFLMRRNRIGIWIYYGQFPFRMVLGFLSFSFLITIFDLIGLGHLYSQIMYILLGLEIFRLAIAIHYHKNSKPTTA